MYEKVVIFDLAIKCSLQGAGTIVLKERKNHWLAVTHVLERDAMWCDKTVCINAQKLTCIQFYKTPSKQRPSTGKIGVGV